MATKLQVSIVGETSGLKSAFRSAQVEADGLSGKFKNLLGSATSLAAGFAGLAAAGGIAALLKDSIQKAESFDSALKSLNVAIKNTGGNTDVYRASVDKLSASGAKLGYTNTDILGGLKTLTLTTGNASDAVKYMGLAEDIAKAKGIDLSAAATAVGKAIDGKTTALQRYGIVVQKGESIEQALADAQKRYAGQAAANTTVTQQLSATVSNLESKIGQALLPAVNKIATAIEAWISKSQNQKKVTDDVREAVQLATDAFDKARTVIQAIDKVTGGFTSTLEILVGIQIVSWVKGVIAGIASIGDAAAVTTGEVVTLESALSALVLPAALVAGGIYELYKHAKTQGSVGASPLKPGLSLAEINAGAKGATGTSARELAAARQWIIKNQQPQLSAAAVAALDKQFQPHSLSATNVHGLGATVAGVPNAGVPGSLLAALPPATYGGAGGSGSAKSKKAPAYKIPQALEAAIRKAQQTFADSITEQHLDTVVALESKEKSLLTSHGQLAKAASVGNEIKKAGDTFQKKLAKVQLDAAKGAITKIEQESTGPAAALKLATAAKAPAAELVQDQQNLEQSYVNEASQLKAKLASSSAAAGVAIKAAITKVRASITSTNDAIVQGLQGIAQTAQANLQSLLSTVETAADSALGKQYYQGGSTPAEAALAKMQAQDTASGLSSTLSAATKQLQADQLAKATTDVIATDVAAVAAAKRAIVENNLSIQATAQRASADANYASAVFNLNSKIEGLSSNVGDGSSVMSGLNTILGAVGINLGNLSDPGGNGLLAGLSAAVQATTTAFDAVTTSLGGKAPSGQGYGGNKNQSLTITFPNYLGSKSDVVSAVQQGLILAGRRNGGNILGGLA